MYMPMNSDKFYFNLFHEAMLILIPLIINLFLKIGQDYVDSLGEKNESRLKSMLEAIGTRPLVVDTVNAIIVLSVAFIMAPIVTAVTYYYVIKYVSFGLMMTFVALYILETFFLTNIIRIMFSHHAAEAIEITLELFGVLIQVQTVLTTVIHPEIVYATSVLPYMQLSWLIRFGGILYNYKKKVYFSFDIEIVTGNNLGVVLVIGMVELCVLFLLYLYIFPVKIAVNHEVPRTWGYLCKSSQWSCCTRN